MSKDKKHFDRLPCGMYRIRSDNSIQKLKDPTVRTNIESLPARQAQIMYTGSPEEEHSPKSKYFVSVKFAAMKNLYTNIMERTWILLVSLWVTPHATALY